MRQLVIACLVACGGDLAPAPPVAAEDLLPVRMRVLTDAQYKNAVRDLLGDVPETDVRLPGTTPHQFLHDDVIAVDAGLLSQYRVAAETIAREVASRPDALGCRAPDDACVRGRIGDFASRAFRRPLEPGELDQLLAIFQLGRELGDGAAWGLVVEAVLQAPGFIYRSELGETAGARVELTSYEVASELGFLFHDSIPDEPLWAAANDGTISDPSVLAGHVERLLATKRARAHLEAVLLDWLEVPRVLDAGKDLQLFPELDQPLRDSMYAETARFVHEVLWNRGGSLRELLTSRRGYIDRRLAEHYKVGFVPHSEAALIPIIHDSAKRAGILTHASVLTILATEQRESIIQRGVFVHRRFLCTAELGRPPFSAIAEVGGFTGKLSESQFSHYRLAHGYCSGCHRVIDPPGRARSWHTTASGAGGGTTSWAFPSSRIR